jgi:hypothetical protein
MVNMDEINFKKTNKHPFIVLLKKSCFKNILNTKIFYLFKEVHMVMNMYTIQARNQLPVFCTLFHCKKFFLPKNLHFFNQFKRYRVET